MIDEFTNLRIDESIDESQEWPSRNKFVNS
jgi:hypothetical protein